MRRTSLVLALSATLLSAATISVLPAAAAPSPVPGVPAGLKKCLRS